MGLGVGLSGGGSPNRCLLPALSPWEHLCSVLKGPGCWDPRLSGCKTFDPSGEQVPGCSGRFVYSDAADCPRLGRRGSALVLLACKADKGMLKKVFLQEEQMESSCKLVLDN